ncbi:MAG: hypothetical protein FJ264_13355 [Planctomycetes bacterium]|nr:hypothetical protein [Planctomycetota bacterium]
MMGKNNYQDWAKEDLIQEIKRLKKHKKYGLVWDSKKTQPPESPFINLTVFHKYYWTNKDR